MKSCVLFKAPSDSENDDKGAYYETLSSAGFQVITVPVLCFEFVHLEELLTKIKRSSDYAGVIFTSPRTVEGFRRAVELEDVLLVQQWKSHTHFAVGETTAKLLKGIGITACGKESGNASSLANVIGKDKYEKPFLYPIGSMTKSTFKATLKEKGIETDDIIIYQTKANPDLEAIMKSSKGQITAATYFIYFSPSGVNFTLPILENLQFDIQQLKFIAIGPTTETALHEKGLTVQKTAEKPNPTALLKALLSLDENT